MRKVLALLLLASASAPALAAAPGDRHNWQSRDDSSQSTNDNRRADRAQRGERGNRTNDTVQQPRPERPPVQVQQPVPVQVNGGGNTNDARFRGRFNGGGNVNVNPGGNGQDPRTRGRFNGGEAVQVQPQGDRTNDSVRNWRGPRVVQPGQVQTDDRLRARTGSGLFRNRVPVISTTPRPGTQPPLHVDRRRTSPVNWNSHWRNDHRYDWRNYRDRHRSSFHLGFYFDPFGWGYQQYQVGWRLWPSYYSSNYWINDPWEYRLPYAPPGTRWIRYYDDALLVDTWSGQVVDVINNFFW